MRTQLRITIVAFIAFTSGILTHTKLHAQINKETALKSENRRSVRYGKASWYSKRSPGINKHTANNEKFDDMAMTCAMWGTEFNQKIRVTNLDNGKSVIVRVNDRGPHKRYIKRGRVIDLTKAAFKKLSPAPKGLINVQIEFL